MSVLEEHEKRELCAHSVTETLRDCKRSNSEESFIILVLDSALSSSLFLSFRPNCVLSCKIAFKLQF